MANPQISVLSNMRLAGAIVLDKNETGFPENPRVGTLLIKDNCLYAYLTIGGLETWFPFGYKNTNTYVHSQGGESLVWTVTHNLGSQKLWYQVQDANGQITMPMEVEYVSDSQVRLHFTEAMIGTAIIVAPSAMDVPAIKASLINVGEDVQISNSGMTINGQPVLTGTTMSIGDGTGATKITYTDKQRLDIAAGVGVELGYDDVQKKITINAPGLSVTPAYVAAEIAEVTGTVPTALNTLEKLSAAINNDAAYHTSVSNKFFTKLDKSDVVVAPAGNAVLRLNAAGLLPTGITGNAATASQIDWAGVINRPTTLEGYGISAINWTTLEGKPTTLSGFGITDAMPKGGDPTQDLIVRSLTAETILPSDATTDIGSTTQRFRAIYVDEAYLSTNTLYLGDTAVMGTSADTITIKSDIDQAITMSTKGTGITTVASERGVNLTATGLNGDVVVQASGAGSKVRLGATSAIETVAPQLTHTGNSSVSGSHSIGGDLTVSGKVTFQGSVFEVNATTVTTSDNIIRVNNGQVGSGVTAGLAGISVDRGDLPVFQMVFDETDDMFKVGQVGQLQTIASQNFVNDGFAPKVHGHTAATTAIDGFMSAADKTKLNGIAANATAYSDANARAAISAVGPLTYNAATGSLGLNATTDNIAEGASNKYFTDARARSAISATGSLAYNPATGVISYTAPTTGGGSGDFKADGSVAMTGALKAVKGTMTAPGIAFAAAPSAGLYIDDTYGLSVAGANERIMSFTPTLVTCAATTFQPKSITLVGAAGSSGRSLMSAFANSGNILRMGLGFTASSNVTRSGKILVSVRDTVTNAVQISEMFFNGRGMNFNLQQIATNSTDGVDQASFEVTNYSDQIILQVAPNNANQKAVNAEIVIFS